MVGVVVVVVLTSGNPSRAQGTVWGLGECWECPHTDPNADLTHPLKQLPNEPSLTDRPNGAWRIELSRSWLALTGSADGERRVSGRQTEAPHSADVKFCIELSKRNRSSLPPCRGHSFPYDLILSQKKRKTRKREKKRLVLWILRWVHSHVETAR